MKWAFKTYDQSLKNLQKLVFAKCPELMGLLLYRFLSTNIFISISGTEVKTVHKFEHFRSILIGVGKGGGGLTLLHVGPFSLSPEERP